MLVFATKAKKKGGEMSDIKRLLKRQALWLIYSCGNDILLPSSPEQAIFIEHLRIDYYSCINNVNPPTFHYLLC
jgi:hypothetical protein